MINNPREEDAFARDLKRKMWITKGARFNAHQRLMSKHAWSTATVSLLSAYVIALALLQFFPSFELTPQQRDVTSVAAIALAIFIMALSLIEASKSYQMKAAELHSCARDLSTLYDRLLRAISVRGSEADAQLTEIADKYNEILNRCHENHDVVDYDAFRLKRRTEFPIGFFEEIRIRWNELATPLPYLALIIGAPSATIVLIIVAH